MKAKDIKVGGEYYTYVSGQRILVRVVRDRGRPGPYQRGRYQVERVDNNKLLTKWRSSQALHPTGEGYWPSMTEKQEDLGLGQANGEYERPDKDELAESAVIADAAGGDRYNLFVEGRAVARQVNWDKAVKAANVWMNRNKYWPNFYHVNERGNIDLLDNQGRIITSWV